MNTAWLWLQIYGGAAAILLPVFLAVALLRPDASADRHLTFWERVFARSLSLTLIIPAVITSVAFYGRFLLSL